MCESPSPRPVCSRAPTAGIPGPRSSWSPSPALHSPTHKTQSKQHTAQRGVRFTAHLPPKKTKNAFFACKKNRNRSSSITFTPIVMQTSRSSVSNILRCMQQDAQCKRSSKIRGKHICEEIRGPTQIHAVF